MVRDTLGEEAVIVATREEQGGKAVRVTAAIDPSDYNEDIHQSFNDGPHFETHGMERPSAAQTWLQYDDEQDEAAVAEEITDAMLRHAVPEDVMDQVLSCATVVGFDDPGSALEASIEHLFSFKDLPVKAHKKALMLVGPPGGGKTLTTAKIAARGAMNGMNIGVISTDTVRAGGIEQLQSFTNLLNIDLQRADNPTSVAEQIARLRACHQIIIDTAGTNPYDTNNIKMLAKLIGCEEIEPLLVLPAGLDAEESGEIGRIFSTIGVESLIPTRIDVARRLGGVLSAAHHGRMHFADASNTSKVADGFLSLNPKNLSKLLMPSAFRTGSHEQSGRRHNAPMRQRQKTGSFQ